MSRTRRFTTGRVAVRALRRVALAALLGSMLSALAASGASALEDFSGPAFQILAPGEDGSLVPTEHSTDQSMLYDALTLRQGQVTPKDIESFYLSEKFGVTGAVLREESTGRVGLTIQRDKNDIPHIFGTTRSDVMFGSGWVAAEDRGLLLRLGLGPAYTAALDVPGISAFGLLLSQRSFKPSAQAVKFVEQQKTVLTEQGARGEQVLQDLESWVEGVNAYEASVPPEQRLIPPVTVTDAIAGFAFIGSIFGNGGGGEVSNSDLLARLEAKFGAEEGLKIFHDLREVNDPEAPTTTTKAFPYDQVPTGATPGSLLIDPGSPSASAVHAAAVAKASRRKASNFLLVGSQLAKGGNPLAVMGPQLGYFYPEIVMQADLHGGGIDAQGIIAPISPYVFIGRGKDFAWSLTSAGSQNTMQFLEQLCNPDASPPTRKSDHYVYKGECIPMTTVDAGEIGETKTEPAHEVFFKETVHGPVTGTVTVGGQPYAIAKERSTRGREPVGEIAFSELDSNVVHSPEQFFEAANHLETTFNMSYLDNQHIAYFSTGRLPVLAAGTDPSLPTLGTGEYDWKGFLSLAQHPHEVDPAGGTFLNWNNKPAPEWGAASDQYSYGPVQRVQMYTGFTTKMNEAKDVSIMNRAALQDLRALKVWPVINQVLATGAAPSKLAEEAAALVTAWVTEKGASRAGLNRPNNPGAAVMDAVWSPIAEAVLSPVLGELVPELKSIASPDNPPSSTGSSFDGGWYGYVYKDLRSLLGTAPAQPYSRPYCGNGSLEACRASLWAAIQTAVEALAAKQGPEPKKWRAAPVRISFPPDPLLSYTMRWTNRSTFQQVITFTGHAP
ncbi:MAG TPA: penicillin acylase family protein [Solirubrobacteraceae bacterium]|jgi:acyl-homoserine lactone acylase PvdQ|nr:penicillin acylase family protein [Solirubrobacteraceae bacterium]